MGERAEEEGGGEKAEEEGGGVQWTRNYLHEDVSMAPTPTPVALRKHACLPSRGFGEGATILKDLQSLDTVVIWRGGLFFFTFKSSINYYLLIFTNLCNHVS